MLINGYDTDVWSPPTLHIEREKGLSHVYLDFYFLVDYFLSSFAY